MSPFYGSDDVGLILLSGYDLRSNSLEMSENKEAMLEETHVFGDSWVAQQPVDLRKGEWHVGGFYDDAAGKTAAALVSSGSTFAAGSTFVLTYGVEGNTIGKHFIGAAGVEGKVTRTPSRGVLTKINMDLGITGQIDDGIILKAFGASTGSTGNTHASAIDNSASSTKGGVAYYQLNALTLDTASSVTSWVRHSDDSTTWVDLTTFTGSTAPPFGEKITHASNATVRRYLAAAWAYDDTAANSSRLITSFVGFARNT